MNAARARILSMWIGSAALAFLSLWHTDAYAYRTAADTPDFEGTRQVRWDPRMVPFVLYNDAPQGIPVDQLASVVNEAMETWRAPTCSGLDWGFNGLTELPARSEDHANTIQFVFDWANRGFAANEAAVTDVLYAQADGGDWRIIEADIYLNTRNFSWNLRGETENDRGALSVLTHELGHALGLMHPCEIGGDPSTNAPDCQNRDGWQGTTMYPTYSTSQAQLSPDDEAGVCFLYPADTCEQMGCSQGFKCTELGCQEECGDSTCGGDEECLDNDCVPRCRSAECQLGAPCQRNRDCHDSLACVNHRCLPGTRLLGDPCTRSNQCESSACIKFGYCAPACETDDDCEGKGSRCREGKGPTHGCQSSLEPLGAMCEESNQCLGNQCLAGTELEPVCTRLCNQESQTECPEGWECQTVQNRSVCVPPIQSDGCVLAAGPPQSSAKTCWLMIVLALILVVRPHNTAHNYSPRSQSGERFR